MDNEILKNISQIGAGFYFFNIKTIRKNAEWLKKVCDRNSISILYAVKAFSDSTFLMNISDEVAGFDISNLIELRKIKPFIKKHQVWLTNVELRDEFAAIQSEVPTEQIIVNVHTLQDLAFVIEQKVSFVLRIALDIENKKSRFGISLEEISKELTHLRMNSFFKGFHFHQGLEKSRPDLIKSHIKRVAQLVEGIHEKTFFLNIGGSIHDFSAEDFEEIRALTKGFKLFVEPGRFFTKDAGFLVSKIRRTEAQGDFLRLPLDISFQCHLKWSGYKVQKVLNMSSVQVTTKKIRLEGSTCYEFDKSALIKLDQEIRIGVGDYIILSNVWGYSWEWNVPFNGVYCPPLIFSE